MKIDVGTLNLTDRHIEKVVEALKSNRLSYGPMTTEFEQKFSTIHNNKYGVFANSGTSALQASLHALKILNNWKNGDEVIMPATTFVATYNVILQNNLKPVLVDIGMDLNIDSKLIEATITKKTKAIMVVHLLGKPAEMDKILTIAKTYKLKVIEDSCETMFVPGIGKADVTCFSFYIAHLLVTGVGGMACTNNIELAELIRSLIFHGRDNAYLKIDDDDEVKGKELENIIHARFRFNHPGYSYRATEVEAALGLVELENYKEMMKKRIANADYLADTLELRGEYYKQPHAFMMFPFFTILRDRLMMFMEHRGITTRTIMPLITQPYIEKTINKKDYPKAMSVARDGLLFGCHQGLMIKELDYILDTIDDFFRGIYAN